MSNLRETIIARLNELKASNEKQFAPKRRHEAEKQINDILEILTEKSKKPRMNGDVEKDEKPLQLVMLKPSYLSESDTLADSSELLDIMPVSPPESVVHSIEKPTLRSSKTSRESIPTIYSLSSGPSIEIPIPPYRPDGIQQVFPPTPPLVKFLPTAKYRPLPISPPQQQPPQPPQPQPKVTKLTKATKAQKTPRVTKVTKVAKTTKTIPSITPKLPPPKLPPPKSSLLKSPPRPKSPPSPEIPESPKSPESPELPPTNKIVNENNNNNNHFNTNGKRVEKKESVKKSRPEKMELRKQPNRKSTNTNNNRKVTKKPRGKLPCKKGKEPKVVPEVLVKRNTRGNSKDTKGKKRAPSPASIDDSDLIMMIKNIAKYMDVPPCKNENLEDGMTSKEAMEPTTVINSTKMDIPTFNISDDESEEKTKQPLTIRHRQSSSPCLSINCETIKHNHEKNRLNKSISSKNCRAQKCQSKNCQAKYFHDYVPPPRTCASKMCPSNYFRRKEPIVKKKSSGNFRVITEDPSFICEEDIELQWPGTERNAIDMYKWMNKDITNSKYTPNPSISTIRIIPPDNRPKKVPRPRETAAKFYHSYQQTNVNANTKVFQEKEKVLNRQSLREIRNDLKKLMERLDDLERQAAGTDDESKNHNFSNVTNKNNNNPPRNRGSNWRHNPKF